MDCRLAAFDGSDVLVADQVFTGVASCDYAALVSLAAGSDSPFVLSVADGGAVAVAICVVWGVGFVVRSLVRLLSVNPEGEL